jgi:hypothetical protein
MAEKVNWLENWKEYDWSGLGSTQLNKTKLYFLRLLKPYLASSLGKAGSKKYKMTTLKLNPDRTNTAVFTVIAYLNPTAVIKPVKRSGPGGGISRITPSPPPQP